MANDFKVVADFVGEGVKIIVYDGFAVPVGYIQESGEHEFTAEWSANNTRFTVEREKGYEGRVEVEYYGDDPNDIVKFVCEEGGRCEAPEDPAVRIKENKVAYLKVVAYETEVEDKEFAFNVESEVDDFNIVIVNDEGDTFNFAEVGEHKTSGESFTISVSGDWIERATVWNKGAIINLGEYEGKFIGSVKSPFQKIVIYGKDREREILATVPEGVSLVALNGDDSKVLKDGLNILPNYTYTFTITYEPSEIELLGYYVEGGERHQIVNDELGVITIYEDEPITEFNFTTIEVVPPIKYRKFTVYDRSQEGIFSVSAMDSEGNEYLLDIGENEIPEGEMTYTLVAQDGYKFVRTYTNDRGAIIDVGGRDPYIREVYDDGSMRNIYGAVEKDKIDPTFTVRVEMENANIVFKTVDDEEIEMNVGVNTLPEVSGMYYVEADPSYKLLSVYAYGRGASVRFDISDDLKSATYDVDATDPMHFNLDRIIITTAIEHESVLPFNNVYYGDRITLNQLNKARFKLTDPLEQSVKDLGIYVHNVLQLPFMLDSTLIGVTDNIILGHLSTDVNSPTLTTDVIEIYFGEIHVEGRFKNSFDYVETECKLYLPFVEAITLEPTDVIDHNIHVFYHIDVYDGTTTINIKNDDYLIDSIQTSIGRIVPFISKEGQTMLTNSTSNVYNGLYSPYVEVRRYDPLILDEFENLTEVVGYLRDYEGYVSIVDGAIEVDCTNEERQMIKSLLQEGIYINGVVE